MHNNNERLYFERPISLLQLNTEQSVSSKPDKNDCHCHSNAAHSNFLPALLLKYILLVNPSCRALSYDDDSYRCDSEYSRLVWHQFYQDCRVYFIKKEQRTPQDVKHVLTLLSCVCSPAVDLIG